MGHLPIIPDVYRCAIVQHYGVIEVVNVIHVQVPAGHSALAVAQDVGKAWGASTSVASVLNLAVALTQVECTPLDGASGVQIDPFSTSTNHAGTNGGAPFPPNIATCVALKTNLRGRSHRGRVYLTAPPTTATTDDIHWTASWKLTVLNAMNAFNTALSSGITTPALGVASYKLAQFTAFDHFVVNPTIGTQRMRLI